jgi:hypothetical protein
MRMLRRGFSRGLRGRIRCVRGDLGGKMEVGWMGICAIRIEDWKDGGRRL